MFPYLTLVYTSASHSVCRRHARQKHSKIVMKLRIIRRDLPLKHVMTVFRGTMTRIRTVIVELEQDGLVGYGEAYEDLHWEASIEDMVKILETFREKIGDYALADPQAFNFYLHKILANSGMFSNAASVAATTAIEMAACDLWGKLRNVPLWQVWGYGSLADLPASSFTLGLDSLYRMLEKFNEQPDWPLYRVKLGSRDDMEILKELRKHTNAPFRLDVNGCWTLQQATSYLDELEQLNIELIEQPLYWEDVEGMRELKKLCHIPLIADESCRSEADLEVCAELFDGVNLKPIKFGGLNATRRAIEKATSLGLKIMIGNTVESEIAASAISQFAPKINYIYIDGPLQVESQTAGLGFENGSCVTLDKGKIKMSQENGAGYSLPIR